MQPEIDVNDLARIRDYPLPPESEIRRPDAEVNPPDERRAALADFAHRLAACVTLAQLIEATVDLLLPELNARVVWMGIRREPSGAFDLVEARCDDGQDTRDLPQRDTFMYRCLTRQQVIRVPRSGEDDAQSVLALPILGKDGALGLIYVDSFRRKRILNEADLDFVTILSRRIAPRLETLISEESRQKRQLAADSLILLRDVQSKLDLRTVPQWPELQVAVYSRPGLSRSGDIHDVMRLPNGLAALLIGHVDAEAARAALGLVEVRTAFRISGLHADPPHIQLKALNWLFANNADPCQLNAAIVVSNPKTGAAEICTAGKIGVLVIDAQGEMRRLDNADAPAVGSTRTFEYAPVSRRLLAGETLVLFTEGCTTARNDAGETLGEEGLVEALRDGFGQPASAALDDLVADLAPYLKDGRPPDDITLLLVHRNKVALPS